MSELSENAMLVSVNVKRWNGRKHDKGVSEEIAEMKGAAKDAGRYNKSLLPSACKTGCSCPTMRAWSSEKSEFVDVPYCKTYPDVTTAMGDLRTAHYRLTLPWGEEGQRILSTANHPEYKRVMDEHVGYADDHNNRWVEGHFDRAVQRFLIAYPWLRDHAPQRLGDLYNEQDWPATDILRTRFSARYQILPIPDAADFRVNLVDREAIQRTIREQERDRVRASMANAWERLHNATMHMTARLQGAGAVCNCTQCNGAIVNTNRLNESAVETVRDLCELLPRLNLTGDRDLTDSTGRLREMIRNINVDELRANNNAREALAEQARLESVRQAEAQAAAAAEPTQRRLLRRADAPVVIESPEVSLITSPTEEVDAITASINAEFALHGATVEFEVDGESMFNEDEVPGLV